MPLTNDDIRRAIAETGDGVKRMSDGRSLMIMIRNGSAYWVYGYRDRERNMIRQRGLGKFPQVSVATARKARDDFAADLRAGRVDLKPRKSKATATLEAARESDLFEDAAKVFLSNHAGNWNKRTRAGNVALVETYAADLYGRQVHRITPQQVEAVIKPIWNGSRTSRGAKLRPLLEGIFRSKRVQPNPASRDAQPNLVTSRHAKPESRASMPWAQVPAFLQSLGDGVQERAIRFIILSAARRDEVLQATWGEFDLAAMVWNVPAERMKMRRAHRVPLTQEMVATLGEPGEPGALVFAGRTGRKLGNSRLCVPELYTAHGMRSTFSTWAQEQGDGKAYAQSVILSAIAHNTQENEADAAYMRSDMFRARRKLMDDWSKFATGR